MHSQSPCLTMLYLQSTFGVCRRTVELYVKLQTKICLLRVPEYTPTLGRYDWFLYYMKKKLPWNFYWFQFNFKLFKRDFNLVYKYQSIYKFSLSGCLFVCCLSVCLYPINGWTDRAQFSVGHNLCLKVYYFCKILKRRAKIIWNPQTFFLFLFYTVQREDAQR